MDFPSDESILAAVDALKDDAVEMLKEIVSYPSTLGNEEGVQNYMLKKFKELDDPKLEVEQIPIIHEKIKSMKGYSQVDWDYYDSNSSSTKGKFNVIASRKVDNQLGKSLIFNGHVDVVPTGPLEMWTTPPFEPSIRDGRLYGRGAGDMKAGIVSFYQAYKALLSLGYAPASNIQLQTVVEEECTGNGSLSISKAFKADCVIIPEPFNHSITTGQLGVLWMNIMLFGKPAHVLDTSAGINAIEACFLLVNELKKVEERWNDPSIRHPLYKDMKHPINFNIGKIEGGEWPSSVPSCSSFDMRVGFFPGVTIDSVKSEIENTVKQFSQEKGIQYKISYNGFHAEGVEMTKDSEMFKLLGELHKNVTNNDPVYAPVTCTTDARFFELYEGTPATCYGPESKSIHGIDESVSIESMHQVTKVLALFISKWCKLEKISK